MILIRKTFMAHEFPLNFVKTGITEFSWPNHKYTFLFDLKIQKENDEFVVDNIKSFDSAYKSYFEKYTSNI